MCRGDRSYLTGQRLTSILWRRMSPCRALSPSHWERLRARGRGARSDAIDDAMPNVPYEERIVHRAISVAIKGDRWAFS